MICQYERKEKQSLPVIVVLLAWLSGCAFLQGAISYYDPATYRSLANRERTPGSINSTSLLQELGIDEFMPLGGNEMIASVKKHLFL